ncbi:transmembrane protein 207 isoform X1 [Bos indicus x Bos taurus]|uniref:Transmembrane protein 207 n=1 Tax=Bos indicus x Bos taurus TaxID=30522 RepID=A0A4W2GZD6_BOBOX|nr:transmembrane protein 207 isoform X1 [Bos indicus x Bos taurus]
MLRSRLLSDASVISKAGILCLPLFQLVLSDTPCEENEMLGSSGPVSRLRGHAGWDVFLGPGILHLFLVDHPIIDNLLVKCINYKDHYTNGWYIWFLLLIFLVALLCGTVIFCFQCCLRRLKNGPRRRTMAVFAVGDLDSVCGTEAAVTPTVGMHLHTQNPELFRAPCFGVLGPPPPYEETKIKPSSDLDR